MSEAVASSERSSLALSPVAAARLIALLVPLGLLAGAYGSQYLGGLYPCEMCWWQRYAHMAALVPVALAFTASPQSRRSRILTLLAALGVAVSGAIGVYHAGVEAQIFQGFTTCSATVQGGGSTADVLKQIMHAPLVRCDQIQWSFLGISLAGWNAIISLSGAVTILFLLAKARRR